MKLVLIQGNALASYEGRKQTAVVLLDSWDFDGMHAWIEEFRVSGPQALAA